MFELHLLPARQGDADRGPLGGPAAPRAMIVDMGTEPVGKRVRARIEALPARQQAFELLVVTHVDADHIGGVLGGLVDAGPLDRITFDDVWFNGLDHLHAAAPTDA